VTSPETTAAPVDLAPASPVSAAYGRYALALLFVSYTLNYLDRQVVAILAEPLKLDLRINDTQLGLLTGLAFGLVYCGLGLPIARFADRFNRVWIIGGSLAVWSVCTILCGRAANFASLVAARVGVGVGEAGAAPASMALISDYVPKARRASALAFFTMGAPVGGLLGMAFGGVLADAYGWRSAFLVAGLPGLVLALVVVATLRETRSPAKDRTPSQSQVADQSLASVFRHLRTARTFWLMSFGAGARAILLYGQAPFLAAFFLRAHPQEVAALGEQFGLGSVGVVGIGLGLISGVFGALSNWLGGLMADHYAVRDLRAYGTIPALAALAPIPFSIAAFMTPSALLALVLLIPSNLLGGLWFGPVLSSIQGVVPKEMRATASSISMFVMNILGLGAGALVVGEISDMINFGLGLGAAEGVRWALIISSIFALVPALLFWAARGTIREEMVS
jgi:predicted MFS family arabinose efflux permease